MCADIDKGVLVLGRSDSCGHQIINTIKYHLNNILNRAESEKDDNNATWRTSPLKSVRTPKSNSRKQQGKDSVGYPYEANERMNFTTESDEFPAVDNNLDVEVIGVSLVHTTKDAHDILLYMNADDDICDVDITLPHAKYLVVEKDSELCSMINRGLVDAVVCVNADFEKYHRKTILAAVRTYTPIVLTFPFADAYAGLSDTLGAANIVGYYEEAPSSCDESRAYVVASCLAAHWRESCEYHPPGSGCGVKPGQPAAVRRFQFLVGFICIARVLLICYELWKTPTSGSGECQGPLPSPPFTQRTGRASSEVFFLLQEWSSQCMLLFDPVMVPVLLCAEASAACAESLRLFGLSEHDALLEGALLAAVGYAARDTSGQLGSSTVLEPVALGIFCASVHGAALWMLCWCCEVCGEHHLPGTNCLWKFVVNVTGVCAVCISGVVLLATRYAEVIRLVVEPTLGNYCWFLPKSLFSIDLCWFTVHIYSLLLQTPLQHIHPNLLFSSCVFIGTSAVFCCLTVSWLIESGYFFRLLLMPSILIDLERHDWSFSCSSGALAMYAPYASLSVGLAIRSFCRGHWFLLQVAHENHRRANSVKPPLSSRAGSLEWLASATSDSDSSPESTPDPMCYPPGFSSHRWSDLFSFSTSGEILLSSRSPAIASTLQNLPIAQPTSKWTHALSLWLHFTRIMRDWYCFRSPIRDVVYLARSHSLLRGFLSLMSYTVTVYGLAGSSSLYPEIKFSLLQAISLSLSSFCGKSVSDFVATLLVVVAVPYILSTITALFFVLFAYNLQV